MRALLYRPPVVALPQVKPRDEQSIAAILGRIAVEVAVYATLAAAMLAMAASIA
jgi:hypothetical protein